MHASPIHGFSSQSEVSNFETPLKIGDPETPLEFGFQREPQERTLTHILRRVSKSDDCSACDSLGDVAQLLDDAPGDSQHGTGPSDQSLPNQPQLEGGGTLPPTPPPNQPTVCADGMLGAASALRGLRPVGSGNCAG